MLTPPPQQNRDILFLLSDLSKAVRCCQQEPVFCEGVTFTQFYILDWIAQKGSLRLKELHEILSVDKSTTTRLVDPLVKQGLVLRRKSDTDSRVIELSLTQSGAMVYEKVWACLSDFTQSIRNHLPEGKRGEVIEAVRVFLRAMQNACVGNSCRI
jgi:DNA-binding MarR family transcriptional regulator